MWGMGRRMGSRLGERSWGSMGRVRTLLTSGTCWVAPEALLGGAEREEVGGKFLIFVYKLLEDELHLRYAGSPWFRSYSILLLPDPYCIL